MPSLRARSIKQVSAVEPSFLHLIYQTKVWFLRFQSNAPQGFLNGGAPDVPMAIRLQTLTTL